MTKRLPLMVLAMLLIVLLAGLGVAYGLWSETIYINGTVNTGNVDIAFDPQPVVKEYINGIPEEFWKGKGDAASCGAWVSQDGNTLTVDAKGAYPSWTCKVTFKVLSTGSVPVHVTYPKKVWGPNWSDLRITDCRKVPAATTIEEEIPEPSCTEADASKCPPWYVQLHTGDALQCTLNIHFTNKDNVGQNTTYTFQYSITGGQFNEYP